MKKRSQKYGWTIVVTTKEAYHTYLNELEKDLRCFISETVVADTYFLAIDISSGNIFGGFAITNNGILKGLFELERECGEKIFKRQLRIAGTIGKNKLVILDCIGEKLKEFYEKFGFKVYNYARWDERLISKEWNSERFGMPNIYYMKKEL